MNFGSFNGVVKLTSQSKPAGAGCEASTASLDYDAHGNVTRRTHFDGTQSTYDYDLSRNLETRRIEAAGTADARTTSSEWHPDWHLKTRVAEPKRITTWVYNGQPDPIHGGTAACAPFDAEVIEGVPIAVVCSKTEQPTTDGTGALGFSASVDGPARTWTYTYNRYGKVLTADGPRTDVADVWTYEYFPAAALCPGEGEGVGMDKGCRGELMRATDPVGLVTEYLKYDAHGQILEMVAPNGVLTRYTYDLRQRMTSQQVGSLLTVFDYDPRGLLERVTLPDGSAMAYAYDDAHRLTGITQAATGERIEYTLDNAGNRTVETVYDANGQVTRQLNRQFDALGRLWKEIRNINGQSVSTDYLHDAEDRLTLETDPLAHSRQWQYNALGQLKTEIDALGAATHLSSDANGELTSVTAANGALTRYTVNGLGQVTQEESPDRGTTHYGYDAAGNLVLTRFGAGGTLAPGEVYFDSDPRAGEVFGSFDASNRVIQKRFVRSDGSEEFRSDYVWDTALNGRGQLHQLVSDGVVLEWAYDVLGRVQRIKQAFDNAELTIVYGYDDFGRLQTLTYPSGRTLVIGYGPDGRIKSLSINPYQIANNVQYHPFGDVASVTLFNGIVHNRESDANGLPARITLGGAAMDYGYDLAGRITSLDQLNGTAYDQVFGYDAVGRITSYTGHPGGQSYTYDANGNRTQTRIGSDTLNFNYASGGNRIFSYSGTKVINGQTSYFQSGWMPYPYDAQGNYRRPYTPFESPSRTFDYDVASRLSVANIGSSRISYRYDGLGHRVEKSGPAGFVPNGAVRFMYDATHHLIGEYKPDGSPLKEYIWLSDLPVAVIEYNSDGSTTAYAIETDHLGTPRLLTDAVQRPRWRWTSPPFGDVPPAEDTSGLGKVTFNLRFPGQYYDKESGLSYNWHRYYDAETGRYVQSDPIGLQGGWNTYGYVNGNPLGYIDPRGLNAATMNQVGQVVVPSIGAACAGTGGVACAAAAVGAVGVGSYWLTNEFVNPWLQPMISKAIEWCEEDGDTLPACDPPAGTICYFTDRVPPSKPHFPIEASHYHLFQMNQAPNGRCFWNPIGASRTAPPGAISCPFTRNKTR